MYEISHGLGAFRNVEEIPEKKCIFDNAYSVFFFSPSSMLQVEVLIWLNSKDLLGHQ